MLERIVVGFKLAALPLLVSTMASAGMPPRAPQRLEFWSANGKYLAISVPRRVRVETGRQGGKRVVNDEAKTTVVALTSDGTRQELWSMPGWFRCCDLSDDGETFVAGQEGLNLVPDAADPTSLGQIPILRFYRRGKLLGRVDLFEIVGSLGAMPRTYDGYYWGDYLGFTRTGRYALQTFDGIRVDVDPDAPEKIHKQNCRKSRCVDDIIPNDRGPMKGTSFTFRPRG